MFASLCEGLKVETGELRFVDQKRDAYRWFEAGITGLLTFLKPQMYNDGFGLMKKGAWQYDRNKNIIDCSEYFSSADLRAEISGKSPREIVRRIHEITSTTIYNCFFIANPDTPLKNEYLIAQTVNPYIQMERGIGFASFLFAKFAVLALECAGEGRSERELQTLFNYALALPLAIAKLNFRSLDKLQALQGEDGFFDPIYFEAQFKDGKGVLGLSSKGNEKLASIDITANEETLGCPFTRASFEGLPAIKTLFPWIRDIYNSVVYPELFRKPLSI